MKLDKYRRKKPSRGNLRTDIRRWPDGDEPTTERRSRKGGASREEWQRTRNRLVHMDISELLELEESIEP